MISSSANALLSFGGLTSDSTGDRPRPPIPALNEEENDDEFLDVKECPKCGVCIEKDGGCNEMKCSNCRVIFDWKTLQIQTFEPPPTTMECFVCASDMQVDAEDDDLMKCPFCYAIMYPNRTSINHGRTRTARKRNGFDIPNGPKDVCPNSKCHRLIERVEGDERGVCSLCLSDFDWETMKIDENATKNAQERRRMANDPVKREKKRVYAQEYRDNRTPEQLKRDRERDQKRNKNTKRRKREADRRRERRANDTEFKDRVNEQSNKSYHNQAAKGEAHHQRVARENPEKHQENKKRMRKNAHKYRPKCVTCGVSHCPKNGYEECRACRGYRKRFKGEEEEVKKLLLENNIHWSMSDAVGPCAYKGTLRRADFVFFSEDMAFTVILEVDEDQHKSYPFECEASRLADLRDQYQGKPLLIIRFAPERKKKGTSNFTAMKAASQKRLINALKTAFKLPPPGENEDVMGYRLIFIGYDEGRVKEFLGTRQQMHQDAFNLLQKELDQGASREREARWKRNQRARKKV